MEQLFATLGYGLAALLGVAALMAMAEHLHRRAKPPPPAPTLLPQAAVVDVDVDLTLLAAPSPDDQQMRQATVRTAMSRMTRPAPSGWTETRPMVSSGAAAEPESH